MDRTASGVRMGFGGQVAVTPHPLAAQPAARAPSPLGTWVPAFRW